MTWLILGFFAFLYVIWAVIEIFFIKQPFFGSSEHDEQRKDKSE